MEIDDAAFMVVLYIEFKRIPFIYPEQGNIKLLDKVCKTQKCPRHYKKYI